MRMRTPVAPAGIGALARDPGPSCVRRSLSTDGRAGNLGGPMQYVAEPFTSDEQDILRPYFTNVDGPVFALVNLPEVVKGALFARYSRSDKSLRRLFLDEVVGDLDISGGHSVDATGGLGRGGGPYEKGFFEYRRGFGAQPR